MIADRNASTWMWSFKGLVGALLAKVDLNPFKLTGEPSVTMEHRPDRRAVRVTVSFDMDLV